MNKKRKPIIFIPLIMLLFLVIGNWKAAQTMAESASAVSIGKIDYDALTLQIYNNLNSIVYYSTDQTTWYEVEGYYNDTTKSYTMDISWISDSSDATLSFKGDMVNTVKTITIPEQNSDFKVTFDKVEGEFLFTNAEEIDTFEWRKASDYAWTKVSLDESSSSYQNFLDIIELFRTKGVKLNIRTSQISGTGINNAGMRPSKEVMITITPRAVAPSLKVNASKMMINTTAAMEYYDTMTSLWMECTSSMLLEELAPSALYEYGAKNVTLQIRKAATAADTYSKTAFITIPGQSAPPSIGDNSCEVTYYYMNSKLILQFNKASSSNAYEYAIIKEYDDYNVSTASWKSVTSSKIMTISNITAPEGCTVYVRRKGIDANAAKNVSLILPSEVNRFHVDY
ncbi:MAG: hypothetical protein K0S47_62 [Herbinix sp.]|jgi:hypothetical protein|nr:hypothetical protein [Herbinix sp.]